MHFSNNMNCYMFSATYVILLSKLANLISGDSLALIVIFIIATLLCLKDIPYNIDEEDRFSVLKKHMIIYRILLYIGILSYFNGIEIISNSIIVGILGTYLTTNRSSEKIMDIIDKLLNKLFLK